MAGLNFIRRPYSWHTQATFAPVIDGTKIPSFCFTTIQERWPKIVTKLVDQLHQFQTQAIKLYGEQGDADVKLVTSKLSEMRYLMMTDKPIQDISANAPDALMWNSELDKYRKENGADNVTWYKAPWLFVECYLYRKIMEFFSQTVHLRHYDPFRVEKELSYVQSQTHLIAIGTEVVGLAENEINLEKTRLTIFRLLQIALWGNKCDLSLSGGDPHSISDTLFRDLDQLEGNILVNDLHLAVNNFILRQPGCTQLDIVLDNAGLEVFADLCLAHFLVSKELVHRVVFHGKAFPWFVSDTTKQDLDWVLDQLATSEDSCMSKLGAQWLNFFSQGKFVFEAHPFWTQPFAYCQMKEKAPELYAQLGGSHFIIFKGDLNYRKLVGDRYWPLDTPFKEALCGFTPAPFLALRTLKAETVAGLTPKAIALIESKHIKEDLSWMVSSEFAVAQLFTP